MLNAIAGLIGNGGGAAGGDFESIQTVSVGAGGSSSISFTSIPSTYKALQLRWIGQDNRGTTNDGVKVSFNSDTTSSNYYGHRVYGNGSSTGASGFSGFGTGWVNGSTGTSIFGASIMDILDYASTSKYKTCRTLGGNDTNGAGEVGLYSMLWMSTSAISTITCTPENGSSFSQYSHFALYGIKG